MKDSRKGQTLHCDHTMVILCETIWSWMIAIVQMVCAMKIASVHAPTYIVIYREVVILNNDHCIICLHPLLVYKQP